jgi:putative peptidoglycan lipid II flippase
VAAWIEFYLLRRSMNAKIGTTGVPLGQVMLLWFSAIGAAVPAIVIKLGMGVGHPVYLALVSLPVFGAAYLFFTSLAHVPEAAEFIGRVSRVMRRSS